MSIPIRCYFIENHHGLVFNAESVRVLREQYRIVGYLTGTLPDYPRQNNELGLPFELSFEEVYLLLQRNVIQLIEILPSIGETSDDQMMYLARLDEQFEEQRMSNGHERINEILVKRHSILENARPTETLTSHDNAFLNRLLMNNNAWQNASRTLDENERDILLSIIDQRLKQFTIEHMFIDNPLESQRKNIDLRLISLNDLQSKINSPLLRLRCDVFCDLYARDYWISNGEKFGGDYLLYLDDPSRCHSSFIVSCLLRNEIDENVSRLPLTHLIGRCRVAVNVNKICVFASRRNNDGCDIDYLSMNWNGF